MTRRVIFLDIDGVLAPVAGSDRYGDLDSVCMQILNDLAARAGAEIVVSSSLRYGRTVAELQAMLEAAGFLGRVVGKTPTGGRGWDRGEEIAAWLAENSVTAFVILDDHRDMGALLPHLVQTNPAVGLCLADAARALEKLIGGVDDSVGGRGLESHGAPPRGAPASPRDPPPEA